MVPVPTNTRDHAAWLAYWGEQLTRAIADAIANGGDFRIAYAVNCARIAHGRALKVKPRLKGGTMD